MERQTAKAHLEFDISHARRIYERLDVELGGEQISSPYDLYAVERLRDEHGLRKGTAVSTDVFVMGVGAPKARHVTKVSGLPFWPRSREWPGASEDSPYQFLAQFNFADSHDLVPKLPGEILLVFVPQDDEDWLWETDRMRFEWVSAAEGNLIPSLPAGVGRYSKSEWYGVLHRTCDYPDQGKIARKLEVDQPYDLPIINGTKIGGAPHRIQTQMEYRVDPHSGWLMGSPSGQKEPEMRFLCQLTSIQAEPNVPYPWTNREEKLTLAFDAKGIYGDDNQCLFGDMGSIYFFLNQAGECAASTECY